MKCGRRTGWKKPAVKQKEKKWQLSAEIGNERLHEEGEDEVDLRVLLSPPSPSSSNLSEFSASPLPRVLRDLDEEGEDGDPTMRDPWMMGGDGATGKYAHRRSRRSRPGMSFVKEGLQPHELKASVAILPGGEGLEVGAFIFAEWGGGYHVMGGWDTNLYRLQFALRKDTQASGGVRMEYKTETIIQNQEFGFPLS